MPRANALFYDDDPTNFRGANARGRHPAVHTMLLQQALTADQLRKALEAFHAASANADGPTPFFFFDFDGTLTLRDGLLSLDGKDDLSAVFGSADRRRALQVTLGTLLAAGRCYILTANMAHQRVADILNGLLGSSNSNISARFVADDTVRFAPAGTKLEQLEAIIKQQGFALVR